MPDDDKLVIFKHGKVLRVKSVDQEDGWSRLHLDGGAIVGVRTSMIRRIQNARGEEVGRIDSDANRATVGGRGPYRGVPPAVTSQRVHRPQPPANPAARRTPAATNVNRPIVPGTLPPETQLPGRRSRFGAQPQPTPSGEAAQPPASEAEEE